ncbi:MAG: PorV/PorQ family protein [Ignavibacteriaceae bacterium]
MNTKNIFAKKFLTEQVSSSKTAQIKIGAFKMIKFIQLIICLLLICSTNSNAQGVSKAGTTSAGFLVIDIGPRGTGLGSAYVSLADDATAMYWNPAGIAKVDNFEATFTNSKWIADLSFNYAGAVISIENFGSLGVNATFLTMEEIERTTIAQPDGTGELFDAGSYAIGISYARNLTEQFAIGFNAKFINERLYHSSANGFAIDVGAIFRTNFNGLTLGMSIANYGTKMQIDGRDLLVQHDIDRRINGNNENINANLETDRFDLPLMFRVGVSMDILKGAANSNWIVSADALHPSDDVESVNVGTEYLFNDMFAVRIGYKGLFAEDSEQGLNFGGGVKYKIMDNTAFQFDYSYIDFGLFDAIHMFSVTLGL